LIPEDFGLIGMVAAFTGFVGLFRDAGLSMATVQRESVSNEQLSTLFWINVTVGGFLALVTAASAPFLVKFYHEPRLLWITLAMAATFIFSGAAVQHQALLQRQMRFVVLAGIEIASLLLSVVVALLMAWRGYGYWALVGMTLGAPIASAFMVVLAARWQPGWPRRNSGVRSMLHFGGTVTLNNIIVYLAYNGEKVLLGRFWGADVLGIYGRAYQLVTLPTTQLNSAIGRVAFPVLSRIQNDPQKLRKSFLKLYNLGLSFTLPVALACALFPEEIIFVFLGPKWGRAVRIFQLLAPTVVSLALINPFGWLLTASGKVGRSMAMALVIAPLVMGAYGIGLPFGAEAVAFSYSGMMLVLVVPMIGWARLGSEITAKDLMLAVSPPFLSGVVAAATALLFKYSLAVNFPHLARLVTGLFAMFAVYGGMLLVVFKQRQLYAEMLISFLKPTSTEKG